MSYENALAIARQQVATASPDQQLFFQGMIHYITNRLEKNSTSLDMAISAFVVPPASPMQAELGRFMQVYFPNKR